MLLHGPMKTKRVFFKRLTFMPIYLFLSLEQIYFGHFKDEMQSQRKVGKEKPQSTLHQITVDNYCKLAMATNFEVFIC